jgi:hypothetical protein
MDLPTINFQITHVNGEVPNCFFRIHRMFSFIEHAKQIAVFVHRSLRVIYSIDDNL